jgi:transposase
MEVEIMKKETYSISQVSQMTGVSKNRIREWCRSPQYLRMERGKMFRID